MKYKLILILSLFSCTLFPLKTFARVSINEVAWMGNSSSQYGEWIEFYNDSNDPVDLKDAVLYEGGGSTVVIKLTKSIPALGYYLIARSTPSMPDPVSGLADDLGSFGGSGLSNSGEFLVLKSSAGDILDSLDSSLEWPAGDSASKLTMQKSGNGWITATGTPRAANANNSATDQIVDGKTTAPADSTGSNAGSAVLLEDLSAHSSPADLSGKVTEIKIIASAGRDRLALVDTPITFEEKLFTSKYEDIAGGDVSWSFGDGQSATGKVITHAYKFPGDYAVVMNVLRNAEEYVARTNVRVVAPDLAVTEATPDLVKIRNGSVYEANLGGWHLISGHSDFTFPKDTIIMQKSEIVLAREVIGFGSSDEDINLFSPNKRLVSSFKPKKDGLIKSNDLIKVVSSTSSSKASATVSLLDLERKLLEARKSLEVQIVKPKNVIAAVSNVRSEAVATSTPEKEIDQSDIIQVIEKPKSFFKTLLNAPVNGFRYIKSFVF